MPPDPWNQFPLVTNAGNGPGDYVPGVNTPDAGLQGPELMRHLEKTDPQTAAAIKSMHAGGMPGTGRNMQKLLPMAALAEPGFDTTVFEGRKKMRDQLALSSPQSLGGQRRNGTTAMEHLATAAEAAADLGNYGGWGIAPLAHAINAARGITTGQAGKVGALNGASQHYGQEITKFYAGSPGGEAERERFLGSFNGAKSPTELADVLEMEGSLIPAKMDQINEDVATTMGAHADPLHATYAARQQAAREKLNAAIAKLRGGAAPGQPAIGAGAPAGPGGAMPTGGLQNEPAASPGGPVSQPGSGGFSEGTTAVNKQTGQRIMWRQGNWVPVQ